MNFVDRLGIATVGALFCAGGIVTASLAPDESPIRSFAVLFAIGGALTATLSILVAVGDRRNARGGIAASNSIAGAELAAGPAPRIALPWESRVESLTAVAVLLLSLGAFLLGAGARPIIAVCLMAGSLPAFLAAATILWRNRGRKWAGIFICLFLILAGTPFWVYLGHAMFGRPSKQPTFGYAELHNRRYGVFYLDLPVGWRCEYHGRDRHQPHEAYFVDELDRRRLDVYAGAYNPAHPPFTLDEIAESTTAAWKDIAERGASEIEFRGGEFRAGATGKVWVARYYRPPGSGYGGREWQEQAVETYAYHGHLGSVMFVVEFHMPAEEVEELEPLTWTLFQTVRFLK